MQGWENEVGETEGADEGHHKDFSFHSEKIEGL